MAFAVYMITTLLTLITFVGERTSGTLQRMLATTLTERDIVMGYATAFSLIGTGQALLLLLIAATFVFHITVVGNVLLAFLAIALLAIVSQALGILLSSTAKREAQAIQVLPFVVLPGVSCWRGSSWPVEAIPAWLRPLSYIGSPHLYRGRLPRRDAQGLGDRKDMDRLSGPGHHGRFLPHYGRAVAADQEGLKGPTRASCLVALTADSLGGPSRAAPNIPPSPPRVLVRMRTWRRLMGMAFSSKASAHSAPPCMRKQPNRPPLRVTTSGLKMFTREAMPAPRCHPASARILAAAGPPRPRKRHRPRPRKGRRIDQELLDHRGVLGHRRRVPRRAGSRATPETRDSRQPRAPQLQRGPFSRMIMCPSSAAAAQSAPVYAAVYDDAAADARAEGEVDEVA